MVRKKDRIVTLLELYPDKIGELIAAGISHLPSPCVDMPMGESDDGQIEALDGEGLRQ